jgi:hypothetical protein
LTVVRYYRSTDISNSDAMAVETSADEPMTIDITKLCNKYAVPHTVIQQQEQLQQLSTDSQQRLQAFTATDSTAVQYWIYKLSTGNPVKQTSVSTLLICVHTITSAALLTDF